MFVKFTTSVPLVNVKLAGLVALLVPIVKLTVFPEQIEAAEGAESDRTGIGGTVAVSIVEVSLHPLKSVTITSKVLLWNEIGIPVMFKF